MSLAGFGCALSTLDPRFSRPRFRRWRAALYACFGLGSITFVVHGLLKHGWQLQKLRMSLVWMAWMAFFNIVGAVVYAVRVSEAKYLQSSSLTPYLQIPERWFPYSFDIFGASHQIFHLAVIIAALTHFAGLLRALEVMHHHLAPCQ